MATPVTPDLPMDRMGRVMLNQCFRMKVFSNNTEFARSMDHFSVGDRHRIRKARRLCSVVSDNARIKQPLTAGIRRRGSRHPRQPMDVSELRKALLAINLCKIL